MKQWLSNMQKEVHVLGPLLPAGFGTDSEEGASVDIETFLGEMLVQQGKRSVFLVRSFSFLLNFKYIISPQVSFGTLNWPSVSEYVDELIDALIEKKVPFVRFTATFHTNTLCYQIRFLLMHVHVPKYRSNRQKESNYQVWEC